MNGSMVLGKHQRLVLVLNIVSARWLIVGYCMYVCTRMYVCVCVCVCHVRVCVLLFYFWALEFWQSILRRDRILLASESLRKCWPVYSIVVEYFVVLVYECSGRQGAGGPARDEISSTTLEVDQSILTGESITVHQADGDGARPARRQPGQEEHPLLGTVQ